MEPIELIDRLKGRNHELGLTRNDNEPPPIRKQSRKWMLPICRVARDHLHGDIIHAKDATAVKGKARPCGRAGRLEESGE